VFRAVGEEPVDGRVVVAPSAPAARERVLALSGIGAADAGGAGETDTPKDLTDLENDAVPEFEVERIGNPE